MSAFGGEADMTFCSAHVCLCQSGHGAGMRPLGRETAIKLLPLEQEAPCRSGRARVLLQSDDQCRSNTKWGLPVNPTSSIAESAAMPPAPSPIRTVVLPWSTTVLTSDESTPCSSITSPF